MDEKGADGYLSAYVDTGEQIVWVSYGQYKRERGSTIQSNKCFDKIVNVKISGTSRDGWAGNIYYSLEDGAAGSWRQMVCEDCDGEVKMPVVVDRKSEDDPDYGTCVNGRSCSVVVSDEIVFELILWMFGIKH